MTFNFGVGLDPFHTNLDENGGFTLITYQIFSVHTMAEYFKNTTTAGHFGKVVQGNIMNNYNITVY